MTARLVIVGASLAGLRAAEAARKEGFTGEVVLVGAEEHLPYDRLPLSKAFLDPGAQPEVTFRDQAGLDELRLTLRLGAPATALDTAAREVIVDGRGVGYDALVIATGSAARRLPDTGELAGVHALRTLDDARAIRAALETSARVVVIGAGFIGSEIAASARKRGLDVTIVEALATPLANAIGTELGVACSALHAAGGTELRCGAGVAAVEGDNGKVARVRLTDGSVLPADLVVAGIGASPVTDWLNGSGLTLDDGVVCDEKLWTGAPGVYAAGDVARWYNPQFGQLMRVEHWSNANAQGARAARNALNPEAAAPYSVVPYFWSDWYDSRIQFAGLPGSDGLEVIGDLNSGRFAALYRAGDQLAGVLGVNWQPEFMKYRALVAKSTTWADAVEFARSRPSLSA